MRANGFDFGENWKDFSANALSQQKIFEAVASIDDLLSAEKVRNKKVLDIGCGSGIFSIALVKLGAEKVIATDISANSIEIAKKNAETYLSPEEASRIIFLQDDILNTALGEKKGQFDVVYSWGVLHHTGEMHRAIKAAADFVKKGGYFVAAIYNRHWSSVIWLRVKSFYNALPDAGKKIMVYAFYPVIYMAKLLVTGRRPDRSERGMDFYYDVVDWLGGYPYEYAKKEEIYNFVKNAGFVCEKTIAATAPTGCNQFVFVKV